MENPFLKHRSRQSWIDEYSQAHQHPVNRACHTFGIPLVALSIICAILSFIWPSLWSATALLFVLGWVLQFVGHAFEGKPPEFFKDWRFLFVGLQWWWAKLRGKV